MSETYVYVISETYSEFHKIGIASDVRNRSSSLQSGNPRPLTPVYSVAFPTRKKAALVERRAHNILKEHRLCSEWFACSKEVVIAAVDSAASDPAPVPRKPSLGRRGKANWALYEEMASGIY